MKDNLIESSFFKGHIRIRVQSVASSAGSSAMMAIVAQPSRGHLNGNLQDDFDMEECFARATVSQSLTVIVSPIDMKGMIGMMQVWQPEHVQYMKYVSEKPPGKCPYWTSRNWTSLMKKFSCGESPMPASGLTSRCPLSP